MFPQFLFQRLLNIIVKTGKNNGIEILTIMKLLHAGTDSYLAGPINRVAEDATGNRWKSDAVKLMLFGQTNALSITGRE